MKQPQNIFSMKSFIIITAIVLVLFLIIGLNYLKNKEGLVIKKQKQPNNAKILKQTCGEYCNGDCAYYGLVGLEKRSSNNGKPAGEYGHCYISSYGNGKKQNVFIKTYNYKNKRYNIPRNSRGKKIAKNICKKKGGVICRKDQLKGRKMCNAGHTERNVGFWGRKHSKGWCGKNNRWNKWKGKVNVHCCTKDEPIKERCGETQTRIEFERQIANVRGYNKNTTEIMNNPKFKRNKFQTHINFCSPNANGTCSNNRCLYGKSGIGERQCKSTNKNIEWEFIPDNNKNDYWRIRHLKTNKYIGEKSGRKNKNKYFLTGTNNSNRFKIITNGAYFKLRDNKGRCMEKPRRGKPVKGIRGDTLCRNKGSYFQFKDFNNRNVC